MPLSAPGFPPYPEGLIGRDILGYKIEEKLGRGSNGFVYKARNKPGSENADPYVAIKVIPDESHNQFQLLDPDENVECSEIQLHRSAAILFESKGPNGQSKAAVCHPNIVRPIENIRVGGRTFFVMPYFARGNLFGNLSRDGHFHLNESRTRKAFKQILNAISRCHRVGICFGDLKPENILVDDNFNLYLTDFGAAIEQRSVAGGCGTLPIMSPEAIESISSGLPYDCGAHDIWTLGITLVSLVAANEELWNEASLSDSKYTEYHGTNNREGYLCGRLNISQPLARLLVKILEPNPQNRIKLQTLRDEFEKCVQLYNSPGSSGPSSNLSSPAHRPEDSPINALNTYRPDSPITPQDKAIEKKEAKILDLDLELDEELGGLDLGTESKA